MFNEELYLVLMAVNAAKDISYGYVDANRSK